MNKEAKPFLKWAGGKTQLLSEIQKNLPKELTSNNFTFIEPFVGAGSVFMWMINNYPNLKHVVINDINEDLINTYKTVSSNPYELISYLEEFQKEYHSLSNQEHIKKQYYYNIREKFNSRKENIILQSSMFIFLNRTCFNGLYRVNKKNEFNVPIGNYKKPTICDKSNLLNVSEALKKVEILSGDFEKTLDFADEKSLFYFDPPYKPLSNTSSFNSYSKDEFDDKEQIRLKNFCLKLDALKHHWILSNSDVKGKDINDNFFDNLYSEFNIQRVEAKRVINANPEKRGKLTELLISNHSRKKDYVKAI
ncbi:MAG: DNA adenine methylase [Ignavibacteria bacterium]|nr:DNA adenine methylase [Ignavibacteria bacterium]